MARYYTEAESRTAFLDVLAEQETYYINQAGLTLTQRVHGAMGAVLAAIEGSNPDLPVFILSPSPDPDYAAQNLAAGIDYFPPSALEYGEDISDGLVEQWNS